MSEKKQLVVIVAALIVLMIVVNVGYNYLTKDYVAEQPLIEQGEKSPAKDFYVYDGDGNKEYLSEYRGGKPVVVNFWASWCPPCKYEMPYFQAATDQYGDEVEILMVNMTDGLEETMEKADQLISEQGYTMNVRYDLDYNAAKTYVVQGIPRTLFIDREGNLVRDHKGLIQEEDLLNTVEQLLK